MLRLRPGRGLAAAALCALAVAITGCGDDGSARTTPTVFYSDFVDGTRTVDQDELERAYKNFPRPERYDPPPGEPVDGQRVIAAAGCLACHQLGSEGNSGPGNNLSGIGARRTAAEIRRAIVDPPPSSTGASVMPPYDDLPRRMLDALVAYLASLRGVCAAGEDCG